MKRVAIGVDPGKTGGIVILDQNGLIIKLHKMPIIPGTNEYDEHEIKAIFCSYENPHVFLENVQPSNDWGIKAISSLFECKGMMKGICTGINVKITLVAPQTWQKFCWEGVKKVTYPTNRKLKAGGYVQKTDTKATSSVAAIRLFPGVDFRMVEKRYYADNDENRKLGLAGTEIPSKAKSLHDGVVDATLISYYGCKRIL